MPDPRDAEQIADQFVDRGEPRGRQDQPPAPGADRPRRRPEERNIVGADLVGAQDAQGRRGDGVIDDGGNGYSAGNGERNGAARILHLAGHDRGAHEAVPRPEEDGGAGHEFQRPLLEARHEVGRLDVRYREEDEDRQQPDHRQHESDDDLARE